MQSDFEHFCGKWPGAANHSPIRISGLFGDFPVLIFEMRHSEETCNFRNCSGASSFLSFSLFRCFFLN